MNSLGSRECPVDFEIFPSYDLIKLLLLEYYNKRRISYARKLLNDCASYIPVSRV